MGLFDDDTSRKRDEVRIGVSEEDDDSKLKSDVESRIGGSSGSTTDERSDRSGSNSSSVSLEDVHEQNERIIELLESIVKDKPDIGSGDNLSNRRNNNRDNSRDSTDDNDQGMRGGMDELL